MAQITVAKYNSTAGGWQLHDSATDDITANSFSGTGSSLTSLNATQLTSGTVPDARIASSSVTQHVAQIDHGSLTAASLTDDDHTQYTLADGTRAFTGAVVGVTPTLATHLATKGYTDGVAQGLRLKDSCRLLADSNQTLSGAPSIDSIASAAEDRVLLTGQTDPIQNGIWVVKAGAWERPDDFAAASEAAAAFTFIEEGTVYEDSGWVCTTDNAADTVDTDALAFTQFSGAGSIDAGAGLTSSGSTINFVTTDTSLTVNANDAGVNASDGLTISSGLKVLAEDGSIAVGASGIKVFPNATFSGLEDSTGLRISAAAAGDGLTGGATAALAVLAEDTTIAVGASGIKVAPANLSLADLGTRLIDNLSDVDTTTVAPVSDDILKFDGSNWVPEQLADLGVNELNELDDVIITDGLSLSGAGPTHQWLMNDATPATTVLDTGTATAIDLGANTGTTSVAGITGFGSALAVDFVSGNRLSNTAASALNGAAVSFAVWVNTDTLPTASTVIQFNNAGNTSVRLGMQFLADGSLQTKINDGAGTATTATGLVTIGSGFQLLCLTYDGSNITASVDAGTRGTGAFSGSVTSIGNTYFGNSSSFGDAFDGQMDAAYWFDYALTTGDEAAIYAAGAPTVEDLTLTESLDDGDFLRYNGSAWVNKFIQTADITAGMVTQHESSLSLANFGTRLIDNLSDVDTTTVAPVSDDILKFDGSNWVPEQLADLGVNELNELDDVIITEGLPANVIREHLMNSSAVDTVGNESLTLKSNAAYVTGDTGFGNALDAGTYTFATGGATLTAADQETVWPAAGDITISFKMYLNAYSNGNYAFSVSDGASQILSFYNISTTNTMRVTDSAASNFDIVGGFTTAQWVYVHFVYKRSDGNKLSVYYDNGGGEVQVLTDQVIANVGSVTTPNLGVAAQNFATHAAWGTGNLIDAFRIWNKALDGTERAAEVAAEDQSVTLQDGAFMRHNGTDWVNVDAIQTSDITQAMVTQHLTADQGITLATNNFELTDVAKAAGIGLSITNGTFALELEASNPSLEIVSDELQVKYDSTLTQGASGLGVNSITQSQVSDLGQATLTSGEAYAVGDMLFIDSDGKAYKASAAAANIAKFPRYRKLYVATEAASAADESKKAIENNGQTVSGTYTAGSVYYLSTSAAGGSQTSEPSTSSEARVFLGVCHETNKLSMNAEYYGIA